MCHMHVDSPPGPNVVVLYMYMYLLRCKYTYVKNCV